jgi:uncharacterized protein YceK
MMKNVLLAIAVVGSLSGCASVRTDAVGVIFNGTSGPVAVGVSTGTSKKGKACASSILGAIATGDASIEAAKKAGGITKVASVDFDSFGVLGIFAKTCTIAIGE